jgi:hypothetical protein
MHTFTMNIVEIFVKYGIPAHEYSRLGFSDPITWENLFSKIMLAGISRDDFAWLLDYVNRYKALGRTVEAEFTSVGPCLRNRFGSCRGFVTVRVPDPAWSSRNVRAEIYFNGNPDNLVTVADRLNQGDWYDRSRFLDAVLAYFADQKCMDPEFYTDPVINDATDLAREIYDPTYFVSKRLIGLEFNNPWDDHGLGVRIDVAGGITVDSADIAFRHVNDGEGL